MEHNVANIYAAWRRLTAMQGNVDSNVVSVMSASTAADTLSSVSTAVPAYTRPGQHLITAHS